jgi:hypothetical protein
VVGADDEEEGERASGSIAKCRRSLTTSTRTSLPSRMVPAKISLAIWRKDIGAECQRVSDSQKRREEWARE